MPTTTANSTAPRPITRLIRTPYRMPDRMSRPWSSVPSGNVHCPSASQTGGMRLSIRFSEARSSGLCGATHGASAAPARIASSTSAAAMATGERRKL